MRELRVVAEKGGSAEQHRAVTVVHQLGNDSVMQRARIQEDLAAGHQRHHDTTRQPERVEQRQGHHELVQGREIRDGADLRDVGQERGVRMHDALGLALGARREQHDGCVIGTYMRLHQAGHESASQRGQTVAEAERALQVFEQQDLDTGQLVQQVSQPGLLEKGA